jgi:hypothetical protein
MKRCPRCGQTYTDANINFCLNDGELLALFTDDPQTFVRRDRPAGTDDAAPTEFFHPPRVTHESPWTGTSPDRWTSPLVQTPPQQFAQFPPAGITSKSLATVSLVFGLLSITLGWCCSTGLLLGPAALVTGLIALSQIKKDPHRFGGKGMAIAGIATGGLFLAAYILFIILYGIAMAGLGV